MPIKIAVDVTPLSGDGRGMGRFASGFLKAWAVEQPSGLDLRLVTTEKIDSLPTGFSVLWPTDLDSGWALWSPFNLPSFKTSVPTILTVHDLAPFAFPAGEKKLQNRYLQAARAAKHIIVSSNFTRREAKKYLNLDESKISTAYLGFNAENSDEAIRTPGKYILAVGSAEPRKNFDGLLRAYARAKKKGCHHKLVIIGEQPPWPAQFGPFVIRKENPLPRLAKTLQIHSNVIFLGAVKKRSTVLAWYQNASLAAVPSLYEGFGYPVLEAYAAGVPLACSNAASLPEVAGDAAIYFNPRDDEAMSSVLLRALNAPVEPEKQKKQLDRFSWKNCIDRYAEIFRQVLA